MIMVELDCALSLPHILYCEQLRVLFATLHEAQVHKRLKYDLTVLFVDSDWELYGRAFVAEHPDELCFILQLLAQIFDLCCGGQPWRDLWLHCVQDRKVRVTALLYSDALGSMGQVAYFDGNFVKLIDLNVFEHHFGRDYL